MNTFANCPTQTQRTFCILKCDYPMCPVWCRWGTPRKKMEKTGRYADCMRFPMRTPMVPGSEIDQ